MVHDSLLSASSSSSNSSRTVADERIEQRRFRQKAIDDYNPMPPSSVYIRPEYMDFIPQQPLFITNRNKPDKIQYEYHRPGSSEWFQHLKQQLQRHNPVRYKAVMAQEKSEKEFSRAEEARRKESTQLDFTVLA